MIEFLILFFLVLVKPTHAYLDPGSGSMLIQIIIGGFLGVGLFVKAYWQKISSFIQGLFSSKNAKEKSDK